MLGFRPDFIEHQLAHAVRDPNGRASNRTAFPPERRVMMQAWADFLDRYRGGEIEPGFPEPFTVIQRQPGVSGGQVSRVRDGVIPFHPRLGDLAGKSYII